MLLHIPVSLSTGVVLLHSLSDISLGYSSTRGDNDSPPLLRALLCQLDDLDNLRRFSPLDSRCLPLPNSRREILEQPGIIALGS